MLPENINIRLEAQATSVNLVTQENLQAARTAQVVNLAQTGGRVSLINLRVKDAQQERLFRTLALATHVPMENTAKFTQQVVHLAQTGGRASLINLRVKDALQESMFLALAIACNVPEQNTAKFTQQVVNFAQPGG